MVIEEPRLRYHEMQCSGLFPIIIHLRSSSLSRAGKPLVELHRSETVCPRPDKIGDDHAQGASDPIDVSETVCPRQ